MKHLVERLRNQLALKEKQQKVIMWYSQAPLTRTVGDFISPGRKQTVRNEEVSVLSRPGVR